MRQQQVCLNALWELEATRCSRCLTYTTTAFSFITESGTPKTSASIIIPSDKLFTTFNPSTRETFNHLDIKIKPVAQS